MPRRLFMSVPLAPKLGRDEFEPTLEQAESRAIAATAAAAAEPVCVVRRISLMKKPFFKSRISELRTSSSCFL
jgi:hypothetical protein